MTQTTPSNVMPTEGDRPVAVSISDGMLRVRLHDGREISTPIDWYPLLAQAGPELLTKVELGFSGVHWPDLDEDLSVAGMLRGVRPPTPLKRDRHSSTA